jgi:hypothetical protein
VGCGSRAGVERGVEMSLRLPSRLVKARLGLFFGETVDSSNLNDVSQGLLALPEISTPAIFSLVVHTTMHLKL